MTVLGGDERQIYMARALARRGWRVSVWGLGACGNRVHPAVVMPSHREALLDANAVILPLPSSVDGVRVHCPLETDSSLRLSVLGELSAVRLIMGGKLPPLLYSCIQDGETHLIDYFDDELLQIKNAIPTAEGALAIAMRELPVVLDGIHAAVIGYGRIATVLADKLQALGAHVYLYARNPQALARAAQRHLLPMRLEESGDESTLAHLPRDCRVIFNTVPHLLFSEYVIERLPPECLYIDLASAPGGIDWAAAKRLGLRTVWGTALPGKCAPESAGEILAETVDEYLRTEGVTLC